MSAPQFNAMASAYGTMAAAMYPDTVTFQRSVVTKSSAGGNLQGAPASTTPVNVPVRYRPASGSELQLAGKMISGTSYMLFVPAVYSSSLIDVDAKCQAVIAARSGGEPQRTLSVQWIGRDEGIEIEILASLEE